MISFIVVAVFCFVAPSLGAPSARDPVFELTDENFDSYIRDKEVMLVDFYAPWCSDCERLKPIFDEAASDLAHQHKYVMAKIDCFGAGRYTCGNKFGIHKWPTLKVFKYGQYASDYHGPEDKDQIEGFVNAFFPEQNQGKQINDLPIWNSTPCNNPFSNTYNNCGWKLSPVSGDVQG